MRCRLEAVPRGAYQITPVFVARAEGAVLEDVENVVAHNYKLIRFIPAANKLARL